MDGVEREPDAYRDKHGTVWANLRKRPDGFPGVFDPTWDAVPLFLEPAPPMPAPPVSGSASTPSIIYRRPMVGGWRG
jgi:hypothetical protein